MQKTVSGRRSNRLNRRILAGIPEIGPGNEIFDGRLNHYVTDKNGSIRRFGEREVSKKKAKMMIKMGVKVESRPK